MSDDVKEQHPLLCEDCSEEERFSEICRLRPAYRGRYKPSIKGASTIITRWPEHWCWALTYWWLGLGIMLLTTFILYNSMLAFAYDHQKKPFELNIPPDWKSLKLPENQLPEIYMKFLTDSIEEFDLNKYYPYVKIIADKHPEYNFNIIVIYNDTMSTSFQLSAEENNEIALNSLWSKVHFDGRKMITGNIKINYATLSKYMEQAPMPKEWRRIPANILKFYVKIVSLWELGGIVINPDILTPRSPQPAMFEKFYNLLVQYKVSKQKVKKNLDKTKEHKDSKNKKKINNIRDVIENLEHDDSKDFSLENLTEAENKNSVYKTGRKLLSTVPSKAKNNTNSNIKEQKQNLELEPKLHGETGDFKFFSENLDDLSENTTKLSIIPFFLEFLFRDNLNIVRPKEHKVEVDNYVRRRKHTISQEKNQKNASSSLPEIDAKTDKKIPTQYKPMPLKAETITQSYNTAKEPKYEFYMDSDDLTIDLKGNIIATRTPCHAFISSLLSNAIHHTGEESLEDFLLTELSLFCKGNLSSCEGIDLILL